MLPQTASSTPRPLRCAIYTRKSSEEGLEQDINSLDAQREAAEAYILRQREEGWVVAPHIYNDGGFTAVLRPRYPPCCIARTRGFWAGPLASTYSAASGGQDRQASLRIGRV
jgi:hypothetical protein